MGHARLSPSSASRWMACPGSVELSKGLPNTSSPAAIEGTNAHTLLEYCINNWIEPTSFIGQVMTGDNGKEFDVDKDMADAVQTAYTYVLSRFNEMAAAGEYVQIYTELKVLPARLQRLDIEGTADVIIVTTHWIEVIDYKHGKGVVVNPENNRQMQIYGIGTLDTLGLDLGPDKPLITTIAQPRAPHEAGPIRSFSYDMAAVEFFTQEILSAAAAVDVGGLFNAGEEQCRWCLAKGICKELGDHSLKAAQAVFTDISVTTPAEIEANLLASPEQLTMDQVTMVLANETLIRGFLDAVHKRATTLLQNGEDVPGFKLVAGRKSKKWVMGDDELSKMLRSIKRVGGGKVTLDDIHTNAIKSPAAMVKMLKGSVTKAAMAKIEGAFQINEGTPQLAPSSSSKVAIATKAADVFEDVSVPSFMN